MAYKCAYIDFDGTVVDVLPRYYKIITDYLINVHNFNGTIDYSTYSYIKRKGIKDHEIIYRLTDLNIDIKNYVTFKSSTLEHPVYLDLDRIIGKPIIACDKLRNLNFKVILLTRRNRQDSLIGQLNKFQLSIGFDDVVMVKPQKNQNSKLSFLSDRFNPEDIIIGDSQEDIDCSVILGFKGYFVNTGLFNESFSNGATAVCNNYNECVESICEGKI